MSGPTNPRHELFQRILALGARWKGAYVVESRTNGPEDLVIIPLFADKIPALVVELKTSRSRSHIALEGHQRVAQLFLSEGKHVAGYALLVWRKKGRAKAKNRGRRGKSAVRLSEVTYEIGGERTWASGSLEEAVFMFLADCWDKGLGEWRRIHSPPPPAAGPAAVKQPGEGGGADPSRTHPLPARTPDVA